MESEKVKEIKEALECCKNRDCGCCKRLDNAPHEELDCRLVLLTDILTLINELESENEKLGNRKSVYIQEILDQRDEFEKQCVGWVEIYQNKKKENQQLKDRIAELEKEKKEHGKKKFLRGWKLGIEEFAERLIEKAKKGNYIDKRSHANLTDFIIDIDETLKEVIDVDK